MMSLRRPYRHVLALCAVAAVSTGPVDASETSPSTVSVQVGLAPPAFRAFVESLWPDADARGISRALFDAAFAGVLPDPSVAALTRHQPEFAKPIGAYLAAQVTPERVAEGRARLTQWRATLDMIEQRFGIPPAIVVAVWGLESNFGVATGGKDAIRSLATLAAIGYRPDLTRSELLAALVLLKDGGVQRANLRGSWAGAMGQPQFMPSSFERFAIDGDGDGHRDIWTDVPDVLASIANFLRQQGYQPSRPWGFEVRFPAGSDPRTSRGSFADWEKRGVVRADGRPMPGQGDATLLFPAGINGPALLVGPNYEVLKTYNFSDAYVLSVGTMADRIEGGHGIAAAWPREPGMAREARVELQQRLLERGYPVDNREGRISLVLRDTIRDAQASVGLVPDGNPTDALLNKLRVVPKPKSGSAIRRGM